MLNLLTSNMYLNTPTYMLGQSVIYDSRIKWYDAKIILLYITATTVNLLPNTIILYSYQRDDLNTVVYILEEPIYIYIFELFLNA